MATLSEKLGRALNTIEARWSLYALMQGSGIVISFGLPAWAVHSANILAEYAPLSWVAAGFLGLLIATLVRFILIVSYKMKVKALFDANVAEKGSIVNPLDSIFQGKRIFLNDFVLPSHTVIENKTFVDCDIIGPATLYFHSSNQAFPIRLPFIDALWLHPTASFTNGFVVVGCIFRNCSFQRITVLASVDHYDQWKDHPHINWIGIPPTPDHIAEFRARTEVAPIRTSVLLEDKSQDLHIEPPKSERTKRTRKKNEVSLDEPKASN